MNNGERWKQLYATFYKETESNVAVLPILRKAIRSIRSGKALDIGAGYGIHTFFLLEHGFSVDAIDFSPESIEYIKKKTSKQTRHRLTLTVDDIRQYSFVSSYDLIVCTYVLQYFSKRERIRLLNKLQRHTRPGGIIVIQQALHQEGKTQERWRGARLYFMSDGELKEQFREWKTLYYQKEKQKPIKGKLDIRLKELMITQSLVHAANQKHKKKSLKPQGLRERKRTGLLIRTTD